MSVPSLTPALQVSARAAMASVIAIAAAQALALQFPLYALVAAVLVTDLSVVKTRRQSAPRLAGTILGAALGAVVNPFLPQEAWAVGIVIFMAMVLSHLAGFPEAAKVAGYVCGIVVLDHRDQPWSYAVHRTLETALGIGSALLLSLVPLMVRPAGNEQPPS